MVIIMAKFQNPGDEILKTVFSLAETSVPYQEMINASCAGDLKIINNSTGIYGIIVDKTDCRYHISTVSDENGKHTALTPTYKASIFQIDAAAVGETASIGDITSQYTSTMTDTFLSHLTDIYASVKGSEEKFSKVLERIETMGTGLPEKEIDADALSPRLSKLYSRLETTRQNQPHILPALNEALTNYNEINGTDVTLFEFAEKSYAARYDMTGPPTGPAGNSGPGIPLRQGLRKALPKIAVGIGIGAVALSLGCTDKPDDDNYDDGVHLSLEELGAPVDAVNGYIEKNWFENIFDVDVPDYENNQLYAMANGNDEEAKAGPPTPTPVTACAVATDPETGKITVYVEGNDPIPLDVGDIPPGWEEHIIKDPSQLIHIKETGENKYQINNLAQEMQVEDGVWKVSHEMGNKYSGDTKFNDNIFEINGGVDDMCGGIVLDDNGIPHGIVLIDEDTWELYGGDFGTKARGENRPRGIDKEDCTHLGNGIYAYVVDLSETPEGMTVRSPYPTMEGLDITDKNGGYAQFMFVKEKI